MGRNLEKAVPKNCFKREDTREVIRVQTNIFSMMITDDRDRLSIVVFVVDGGESYFAFRRVEGEDFPFFTPDNSVHPLTTWPNP